MPKANDEVFGIEAAERNTYWCNLAMVRADRQGKGIGKAMFELAYKEVTPRSLSFRYSIAQRTAGTPFRLRKLVQQWP